MPSNSLPAVTLFTPAEHEILATWLSLDPDTEPSGVDLETSLAQLGIIAKPSNLYTREDAAVARILLESVERRLPQWAALYFLPAKGTKIRLGRNYRDPDGKPLRKVSLVPRHLFTINWADSAPGLSWPVQYNLIWVPHYERFVVTSSADSTDAFGYCDFALGHFSGDEPIEVAVGRIIRADWAGMNAAYEQERWQYLLDNGLINQATAESWADEVWGEELP